MPANYSMTEMLASYDAKNAEAIARVVAGGAQLSVLPEEIVKALRVGAGNRARRGGGTERAVQEGADQLARLPGQPAPLVLDRRLSG